MIDFKFCHIYVVRVRILLIWGVPVQALTPSKTKREEQRRRGRERRAPDKSTKLRVRSDFFCTNATSGIMRRRQLMCESRKERSDGIAIATKSIASSCPARRALPYGRRGKHVRKGDIFLICSHFACLRCARRQIARFFKKWVLTNAHTRDII